MTYYECYTVIEGAQGNDYNASDWDSANGWMENQVWMANLSRSDAQAYFIAHDHGVGIDCECVQYLTDHRPFLRT